ncbi:peptidase M18 [Gorgonomyces haynaldii]|nr:peptidase M18 [Gorgonomyces haynaldii]
MLAKEFLKFVDASPSPFHAVKTSIEHLTAAGFTEIFERDSWSNLVPGGKYFFTRNRSAIIAFCVGGKYQQGNGFSIVGAHTDSPCLKVKPRSKREKLGYMQVGVELYGGGLWHTWFDRDLALAGRVLVENKDGNFDHKLVHIKRTILRIPTLAIHLDRNVNNGFSFNNENQLTPVLAQVSKELNKTDGSENTLHHPEMLQLLATELNVTVDKIRDFELCLYDTQPAALGGLNQEFIHAARLDNLMMSFCALNGLLQSLDTLADDSQIRVVGLFDNEEVGSNTAHGADSNLLEVTLRRLSLLGAQGEVSDLWSLDQTWVVINTKESPFERAITKSLLVSADMAHSVHPNYVEKHEDQHRPVMNAGVVIKQNANQRYATTSISTLLLRQFAKKANVALQEFVVRNDSPCGSTIGPMLSAKLGLRTIDVGNPQWSMHSIRETCGTKDVDSAVKLFTAFFEDMASVDARMPKV